MAILYLTLHEWQLAALTTEGGGGGKELGLPLSQHDEPGMSNYTLGTLQSQRWIC